MISVNVLSPSLKQIFERTPIAATLLVVAVVFLLWRIPWQAFSSAKGWPSVLQRADEALHDSAAARIQKTIGLAPATVQLLRQRLSRDGRLVVYFRLLGNKDEQVFWEKLLRDKYEQIKNLLYPTPRDSAFARNEDELAQTLGPQWKGKLIVVDCTQDDGELPVRAQFELLTEERIGSIRPPPGEITSPEPVKPPPPGEITSPEPVKPRMRFWLLRKVGT